MKKKAVIILNWNGSTDTIELLKSLHNFDIKDIFVLDNNSSQEDLARLSKFMISFYGENLYISTIDAFNPEIIKNFNLVESSINLGFAKGNNSIMSLISDYYEYLILLNNDTVFYEDSISKLINVADTLKVDLLTSKINYFSDKDSLWNAGGNFNLIGERTYFPESYINEKKGFLPCEFITGCFLVISQNARNKIGLLSDDFFFGEEDFNYCYKAKQKKLSVGVFLNTVIYHKVSQSLKTSDNKLILHFVNRIIDKKLLYNNIKYILWKIIYLKLIRFKYRKNKNVKKIIKYIKYFSKKNKNVLKPIFDEIMSLNLDTE